MKIFILYDEYDRAYPIIGLFPTLEAARKAAPDERSGEVPPGVCIYEETLHPEGALIEPVRHEAT